MALQEPRNLSWNDSNKVRRFPLLYGVNPVSIDGQFTIPDDFLTYIAVTHSITNALEPGCFYIDTITYFGEGASVSISYLPVGGESRKVSETTFISAEDGVVKLVPYEKNFLTGFLVLGKADSLKDQPYGEWRFEPSASTIDPSCIVYTGDEPSSLYVDKGDNILGPFVGDITLVQGDNVVLSVSNIDLNCINSQGTGTQITIDAIDEAANQACIRTINGVKPDTSGNIEFVGQNCLKITPEIHSVLFDDNCAEPCCSCEELTPVEEKIEELQTSISTLKSRMETLISKYEFVAVALGISR
jgi:hypothetical protein